MLSFSRESSVSARTFSLFRIVLRMLSYVGETENTLSSLFIQMCLSFKFCESILMRIFQQMLLKPYRKQKKPHKCNFHFKLKPVYSTPLSVASFHIKSHPKCVLLRSLSVVVGWWWVLFFMIMHTFAIGLAYTALIQWTPLPPPFVFCIA